MKYLDPRTQKLVEALKTEVAYYYKQNPMSASIPITYVNDILRNASEPLKEFAGLSKERWLDLAMLCEMSLLEPDEANACRQIAESLE